MFSNLTNFILNYPLSESFENYWNSITSIFIGTTSIIRESSCLSLSNEILPISVHFDEFQWKLVKAFLIFLILNLFLIFISWKIYGKDICERFMKPPSSQAIEELKSSVSKLKLPKEHTPRI